MKSRPNTFPVAGGGRFIGARVSRVEDPRHLTGEALFTADVRLPRMTSACFVRSLEAHARIRSIDTQAARQLPGVIAVFTAADIQAAPLDHQIPNANLLHTPQPVLAIDKVRFVGEPLAVVVARDRYIAEDAVDLVIVDYEPLPVVTTPEAAMAADAPLLFDELGTNVLYDVTGRNGDVAAAFARADRTFTATYPGNRFVAAPMEGRAALADYKSGTGELTLWCSTQTPHLLRTKVAAVLTFPEHKLRVIAPEVGGGFGQKMSTYPEEAAIAATARKLGRPVSWVEDRVENLIAATHAKEQTITLEAAVASDGTLLALRATHIGDAGAYSVNNTSALIEPNVGALNLPGLYRLAAYEWRVVSVVTNRSPIGPYRAVGSTAGSAARDLFFAHIAGELGIDVSRFLRANMIRPEDMPYTSATGQTYDSGSYIAAMDKSLEMMDYPAFRAEQQRLRKKGRYVGIGIAPFVEATAWGSELAGMQGLYFPSFDNATVSIDPGGKITVRTSMAAHGQGHETAFAQIAADILGVDIADVTVQQGDTATAPYGMGTFASRSAVIGGGSLTLAAQDVRAKVMRLAARALEAAPEDLDIDTGHIFVKGSPETSVSHAEIAARAHWDLSLRSPEDDHQLTATRFYDPPATFSNGCFVAVVEVDVELGTVKVARVAGVEDCGTIINPMLVEGQSYGAVAQAVGGALLEHMIYADNGQPVTANYMDYLLPTTMEVPPIDIEHLETPSPNTVGGVKGMGEGGLMSAPGAILCAVMDALAPFDAELVGLPLSPTLVLQMIGVIPKDTA